MRARIVKRDEKIVVLKTEKDKFLKVPKKNIDFDYKVGDWVTIEKKRTKYIFFLKIPRIFEIQKIATIIRKRTFSPSLR